MPVFKDLSGKRFGRLTVLTRVDNRGPHTYWSCVCDCGNKSEVYAGNLTSNHTTSCGCYLIERRGDGNRTHGKSSIPEYHAWAALKARCTNPKNNRFHTYGKKGIIVCDRWKYSFEKFYADMGKRPSERHSIDRIDNDGDYEPSNCRWATIKQQNSNRGLRKDNKSGVAGVSLRPSGKWAVQSASKYVGTFDDFEEACEARKIAEENKPKY